MRSPNPPEKKGPRRILLVASTVFVALTIALPQAASGGDVMPPPVPANLEVPQGNTPFLVGHARGTQNYVCLRSGAAFTWTFFGPQATLFDDAGQQLITHFLSPNPVENGTPRATWQHSRDTSAVWAAAIASSSDSSYVAPGAIPWLLLQVVGAQYGSLGSGTLTPTTFIQRVNTAGGIAPGAGCASATDIGKKALMPYTADYVLYRPER